MYALNAAAILALVGIAAAQPTYVVSPAPVPTPHGGKNGTITVTSVYEVYTTYCPEPTSFHLGGKDYVVTEPTTLIITDCPCTVTETHPAGPTWIPSHPGGGKPYNPVHPKPGHPEEPGHPLKPEHPVKPGHPEEPEHPVQPEHPEVQKPGKPETPAPGYSATPEHPATSETPETPETEKPSKGEDVPETPVITAGAGAVSFSLGLAAIFGLMAL
ncbi:Ff.00g031170.m01.CDS01 [Fusarium sp. VM40]|nr:Ff.00g031170.m01.CDS01 [Fusarium sp. VM40]